MFRDFVEEAVLRALQGQRETKFDAALHHNKKRGLGKRSARFQDERAKAVLESWGRRGRQEAGRACFGPRHRMGTGGNV